MKEIITIEISEKNNASEKHSKALTVVPITQKSGFKQFVSKIWKFLIGKEITDSSALLKLGIAVKKYRFSLAIIGLVFMLIFRNDNTKAIGLKIDESKEISLNNEQMESISKSEDMPNVKKSAQKNNTVSRNNASLNKEAETEKSYHIPNIPELSNRKKISGDLAKNSAKAIDLYISKYLKLAKEEAVKSKIPTSVILGLALINSSYGLSKTALNTNNHFEIKCAENSIPMGKGMKGQYVSNDFCFTEYNTVRDSYRAHSNLMLKAVKKYSKSDKVNVKSLIKSLEKSGYFNNRGFSADDLLQIIEENNLNRFNQ
jgi:flagellum-specific peptidoglycan hydrolase FlgJ